MRFNLPLLAVLSFLASACGNPYSTKFDENLVGERLKEMSSSNDNADKMGIQKVALYDSVAKRIHQFDTKTMALEKSYKVADNGVPHFVLYDQKGSYIIDVTTKSLTVFDKSGEAQVDPVKFKGTPLSGAFRPELGLLVVYDDLMTVGILRLNEEGVVQQTWSGGPVLKKGTTLNAGDINSSGQLVLALSDGSFSIVDLYQTLDKKEWIYSSFDTLLTNIKWVAPVRGEQNKMLVVSDKALSIVDTDKKSVIETLAIQNRDIVKYSKSIDPHVLISSDDGTEITVVYASDLKILKKSIQFQTWHMVDSRLDLQNNTWDLINITESTYGSYGVPWYLKNRVLKQWRFTDLLATGFEKLPDLASFQIMKGSLFVLLPSALGYAYSFDVSQNKRVENKAFNLRYLE
jgi:hypothetical protein